MSKYPPKYIVRAVLSRYHHYLFSDKTSCNQCLQSALSYSSVDTISFIAFREPQILGQTLNDSTGDIPLHRAGNTEIASILVRAYPDGVGIKNNDGNLPIHLAIIHYKSPDQIRLLIEEGKRQKIGSGDGGIHVKNKKGETPFSILCKQVATGIDMAYITFPLFRSDLRLWENLNTLLIAYSTNHNGPPTHRKFRILHSLISANCPQQAILMAQIIDPNQVKEIDETGRYPLSLAAGQQSCRRTIVQKLLNGFPQAIHEVDKRGRLPLHWAALSGSEGIEDLLSVYPSALHFADNDGMFPFMLAASNAENALNVTYTLLRQCPENIAICK